MNITYWKPIALFTTGIVHFILYYFDIIPAVNTEKQQEIISLLFSTSANFIGFIFTMISIIVAVSDHHLIQKMKENGMYQGIMNHLGYLITGFSIVLFTSYIGKLIESAYLLWILYFSSIVFLYSMIMLITDMSRRLILTLRNLR